MHLFCLLETLTALTTISDSLAQFNHSALQLRVLRTLNVRLVNKLLFHVFTVLQFSCGTLKLVSTDGLIILIV